MNSLLKGCTIVGMAAVVGLVGCTNATSATSDQTAESAVTGLPSGAREKLEAEQRAIDLRDWATVQATILDAYSAAPSSSVSLWNPEIKDVYAMTLYNTSAPELRLALNRLGYANNIVIRESEVVYRKGTVRFFATTATQNVLTNPNALGTREKLIMTCKGVGIDQGPEKSQCVTHAF
jgi:hypothetical protein